jgi:hypothetical protein
MSATTDDCGWGWGWGWWWGGCGVPRSESCYEGIKNNIIIRLLHTKLDENTNKLRWKGIRIFGKNNFSNMGLSHLDMRRWQEIGNIGIKLLKIHTGRPISYWHTYVSAQKCPIYRNSKAVRDMVLLLMYVWGDLLHVWPIVDNDKQTCERTMPDSWSIAIALEVFCYTLIVHCVYVAP